MKRSLSGLTGAGLCLLIPVATACSLENAGNFQLGEDRGIKGTCSNNGQPVACYEVTGEGLKCIGPAGGFTGNDYATLVFSACGCGDDPQ